MYKIINADEMTALLKKHHFKGIKDMLATAPKIIYCKDCVNCEVRAEHNNRPVCMTNIVHVTDYDYCSFAERRMQ